MYGQTGKVGVRDFAAAIFENWFTAMSGPLTVPTAVLGLFIEGTVYKIFFGVTAFICFWAASYKIWKREREKVIALESTSDVLSKDRLEQFVRGRAYFTIAEAACLLTSSPIKQEGLTNTASMCLHDIKKRLIDKRLEPIKFDSEISLARFGINTSSINISDRTEIDRPSLIGLAKNMNVKIPGLEREAVS